MVVYSMNTASSIINILNNKEKEVDNELYNLYRDACDKLTDIDNILPNNKNNLNVGEEIIELESDLSILSQNACELSVKVEGLDNTKNKVHEAYELTQAVIIMHNTVNICNNALLNNNIEDAAKAIANIRDLKDKYPDLCKVCDTPTIKESIKLEDEVCSSVRELFDTSIISGDKDGVRKCGRLFYPLGMENEGVSRYVRFIRQTLAQQCQQKIRSAIASSSSSSTSSSSPSNNDIGIINDTYLNTLTDVFLAVADIIQDHQRNIEEEFGPINFIMVLRGLQSEAVIQAMSVINRIRKSRDKIMKGFENKGDEIIASLCSDKSVNIGIDNLALKDAVINEICLIAQRCNQFNDYIHNISKEVMVELNDNDKNKLMDNNNNDNNKDGLPENTELSENIQVIMGEYVLYERSFILCTIVKAKHEDRIDIDDPQQMTSSVVDDVFFVLHKAVERSLSSEDIDSTCAVINNIVQILSNEYKTICLDKPLQDSKRNFASFLAHREYILEAIKDDNKLDGIYNNKHPLYRMYTESDGITPLEYVTSSQSWPHALSNIALSSLYVGKLYEVLSTYNNGNIIILQNDNNYHGKREMYLHTIEELEQVRSEFDELTHYGCKMCLHQLKIQYLSPALSGLDHINYDIDEDEYNDYQINDPFAQHFINETDMVLKFLRLVLPQACINIILALLVDQLTSRIEKYILLTGNQEEGELGKIHYFSMLGAIQFDQDIRRLLNYFTSVSDLPIRRKFSRLLDICTLLSLETLDEFNDLYAIDNNNTNNKQQYTTTGIVVGNNNTSTTFRLSKDEVKRVLLLRRFPSDKIDVILGQCYGHNNYNRYYYHHY